LNSGSSSSDNSRIGDLKTLANALQSGDLSGAQQAFANLQQTAKSGGGHHHHHHATSEAAAQPTPAVQPTGTDSDGDNDGSSTTGSAINATA